MIKNRILLCALLVHLAQFLLCFLYSGGGPLLLIITLPLQILLFLMNSKAANTWLQVILLGVIHLTVTICAYQTYGWLFFRNIHYDEIGEAIILGITLLAAGLVVVLWIINIVIFVFKQRKRKTADAKLG